MTAPLLSAATCLLCDPPEVVGAALMDHLRLFHPDQHDEISAALSGDIGQPGPDPDLSAPFEHPVITEADLQSGGIACTSCGYLFKAGDRYSQQPEGMTGGIPAVSVACVPCGSAAA